MRALLLLGMLALAGCDLSGGTAPDARRRVVVWSSTDRPVVRDLLAAFRSAHPDVAVSYVEMPALAMHDLMERRTRSGQALPDIVWTAAMDLQIKLVNDGYALRYASPEGAALPDWANWKNEAWGITAEPIVMVYNRRLIPPGTRLADHADLLRLLEKRLPGMQGRVATYDIADSATGYLYLYQDTQSSRLAWPIVRALGANGVRLFSTSEEVIADVSQGRSAVGYNVLGAYAVAERHRNPDLRVVLPSDYTLLASRIAMIPAAAPHPGPARLFLDFLLSRDGQRHLVAHAMPSVRRDIPVPEALRVPGQVQRAIRIGPALLVVRDRLMRRRFLEEWQRLVATGRPAEKADRDTARLRVPA